MERFESESETVLERDEKQEMVQFLERNGLRDSERETLSGSLSERKTKRECKEYSASD